MFPVLVLLITCTNVSALLAGLGVARRREIAVRLALGAGRRRVVRQLVTETVMLAMAAGALGLFVIWLLLRLFDASIPDLAIEIDWRSIAFTFSLALVAGVLFGFSPALHATRLALQEALKDSAGVVVARRLRLQSWLVVAQIAFTQPALLGMGALLLEMRSDLRATAGAALRRSPPRAALQRQSALRLARRGSRADARPPAGAARGRARRRRRRAAGEPRFSSTSMSILPTPWPGWSWRLRSRWTRLRRRPATSRSWASRSYAAATSTPSRAQRRTTAPSSSAAAWHAGCGAAPMRSAGGSSRWVPICAAAVTFTVVGVVDDATTGERDRERRLPPLPGIRDVVRIYKPRVHMTGHLLVRTHGPAEHLLPTIRAAAADEAPALPIVAARTLAAAEASERRSVVTAISAAGGAGALALLLSAIGLYAVVAFAVGQRVREIGIRTALGAESRQVVRLFVGRGLRLCLVGLVLGLALGIGGARVIAAVEGNEPPAGTLGLSALVAVFVIGVALLASWIPARRAARIDPLEALRVE